MLNIAKETHSLLIRKAQKLNYFKLLITFSVEEETENDQFSPTACLQSAEEEGGEQRVVEGRGMIIQGTFNCASRAARHYLRLIPVRHPDSPAAQEAGFTP